MENVKNKGTTNDRLIAKEQRIMRLKELKIISRFAAKGLISFSTILVGLRTEHWVSSSAAKRRDESLLFLDFRLEGFDIDGGDTSGRGEGNRLPVIFFQLEFHVTRERSHANGSAVPATDWTVVEFGFGQRSVGISWALQDKGWENERLTNAKQYF